ncbi:MAG: aminotransferase class V-fold PLP-dependent enzyme [Myxococcales bacterium]|nr:aminotransferase class V-fold PLP-dependent enzyme [Myxococcales bacterium]
MVQTPDDAPLVQPPAGAPAATPPRSEHRAILADRSLFPDLEARSFLAHSAISPLSLAVRDQISAALADYGRGGLEGFERWLPHRERLRSALAAFVGAAPSEIGLVPNTTLGVIDVAMSIPWRPGDRVLLFEGEFPTNITPWQRAAELFELQLEFLPIEPFRRSHQEGLSRLEAALERGARLVALSAVQFQTGLRMPLEAIAERCSAAGTEVFIDAIQACGAVPLRVREGIDYLACGGHKWLMGPEGTGFLYVSASKMALLEPRLAGWLSHEHALDFLFEGPGQLRRDRGFREQAAFFEQGTQNMLGQIGLEASLELLSQLGAEAIFRHTNEFIDALEEGLVALGFESLRSAESAGRSAILSLRAPEELPLHSLQRALRRRGVICTIPDGLLRFAPHWPNSLEEVPVVVQAVEEALRE